MTHPIDDAPRLHSAREQHRRERVFDKDFGLVESLRMTGQLGPVLTAVVFAGLFVYAGAYLTGSGQPLGGLFVAGAAVVMAGLGVDTGLCKGTPASVHECRRCRRETDRWRGPTRDSQWVTSLVGQPSAASDTPRAARCDPPRDPEPREWSGEARPAVRRIRPPSRAPRTVLAADLFDEVDDRALPDGGAS